MEDIKIIADQKIMRLARFSDLQPGIATVETWKDCISDRRQGIDFWPFFDFEISICFAICKTLQDLSDSFRVRIINCDNIVLGTNNRYLSMQKYLSDFKEIVLRYKSYMEKSKKHFVLAILFFVAYFSVCHIFKFTKASLFLVITITLLLTSLFNFVYFVYYLFMQARNCLKEIEALRDNNSCIEEKHILDNLERSEA